MWDYEDEKNERTIDETIARTIERPGCFNSGVPPHDWCTKKYTSEGTIGEPIEDFLKLTTVTLEEKIVQTRESEQTWK